MDSDYIKALIQSALWKAYKITEDEHYKQLYECWYENFERIQISDLGEVRLMLK